MSHRETVLPWLMDRHPVTWHGNNNNNNNNKWNSALESEHHVMKAYNGRGDNVPGILDPDTRWW
jgi:hypothetical protein